MKDHKMGAKTEQTKENERKMAADLQISVKKIHFGSCEEKDVAAEEIKRLAGVSVKNRKLIAELGVIPPLVTMVDSNSTARRRLAVQTLIQLADGTYTNKALIVEAGILSIFTKNIDVLEEPTSHEFAKLVFSVSSLVTTQHSIPTTKIIRFVIIILESNNSSIESKELCIGTLFNLSTSLDNIGILVNNGIVIDILVKMSVIKQVSQKVLATLGNLVVTIKGRKALEDNSLVPENLIDILTWEEKPKSQELSIYILMVLAHQSVDQQLKMAKARIVPVLVQLALLASPIAQKRSLKLLQWFKEERQTKMDAIHSGPQSVILSFDTPLNFSELSKGKRLMKNMVKESLYKNMEIITRRASGDNVFSDSKLFAASSRSKSLPY